MLIATRNRPSGPNLNHLEDISIRLSGNQVTFSMPAGNNFDIPEPQGKLLCDINIYERSDNGSLVYENSVLAERNFRYKGFLGSNLGSMSVTLQLSHVNNQKNSLLITEQFIEDLKEHHTKIYTERNKTADQSCQIQAPESYAETRINNINFLQYQIDEMQSSLVRSYYSTAITDDFYITFMFRHHTIRHPIEPWHVLSRALEQKIICSASIKLCGNSETLEERLA